MDHTCVFFPVQVTTCAGRRHGAEPRTQRRVQGSERDARPGRTRMTTRPAEAPGLSVPLRRCRAGFEAGGNGTTCAEQLGLLPPFSSALALLVLVAVLAGIVLVSLATFHFHKRKLRNRKIRRAQEEYERDSRSPARGEPARPCVMVRPVRREEKPSCRSGADSGDVATEDQRAPHETVPLDC